MMTFFRGSFTDLWYSLPTASPSLWDPAQGSLPDEWLAHRGRVSHPWGFNSRFLLVVHM